mgnify:CR=1 FL=1
MRKNIQQWYCRTAPSLGNGFSGTPESAWGVLSYNPEIDLEKPTVFMGLYGFKDFYSLWQHKGIKEIFWCGSDITNFINGYWIDEIGEIRINPQSLVKWITRNCGNWVENKIEQQVLENLGISSRVIPSFLGNVKDYKIEYKYQSKLKFYTSVSGEDFLLYGWHRIEELAQNNPDIEFHLYGNIKKCGSKKVNIIDHGRVSKEIMNNEIKKMTGALRLTEFDGFSEIIAKSLLWGQWPISLIQYPDVLSLNQIDELKNKKEPNYKGREWLLSVVNKYPWVKI